MTENKNYDLNYLKEISGGDEVFVNELIEYFVLNTPDILNKLKSHFNDKDFDNLGYQAHKFSSNVSFLGANELSQILEQVHINILKKENMEEIPQMLHYIENNCIAIVKELKEDFNL
jgi:HPt (histidine-containing phosphotransfer) domain-containing protein